MLKTVSDDGGDDDDDDDDAAAADADDTAHMQINTTLFQSWFENCANPTTPK